MTRSLPTPQFGNESRPQPRPHGLAPADGAAVVHSASVSQRPRQAPTVRDPRDIAALLRHQASLLSEAAEISAQIAEIQVAASAGIGVMGDVTQLSPDNPALAASAPVLTVADVARRLQVAQRTVRRWRQSGELPAAIEVSGIIRWRAEVIEDWVLAREQVRAGRSER